MLIYITFLYERFLGERMKKVLLGADHAGFSLKEKIKHHLGDEARDCSSVLVPGDDYPDVAAAVAAEAVKKKCFAVLVCGSGHGMCITANKIPGVRAVVAHSVGDARIARVDNDANVLCLGGRVTPGSGAARIVDVFLKTGFAGKKAGGARHKRRVKKIIALES